MNFTSKGNTLKNLKLKHATVPTFLIFKVKDFKKNKKKIINQIIQKFITKKLIVRSSFIGEDSNQTSMAGKYLSIGNLNCNKDVIKNAIQKVIKSFKNGNSTKNQFIVQEFITNSKLSGVITTADIDSQAPYININFTKGLKTDLVTSGIENSKSLIALNLKKLKKNNKFKKLGFAILELQKKFKNIELDIEFVISKTNQVYILQVRPLLININFKKQVYEKSLNKLEKKIKKLQKPHFGLYGDVTYFGVMPDWNPAEIIGTKPRPLALSLYQELITNTIWAKNRGELGYLSPQSNRLMTTFLGTPYVDLRVDFNSWIPKSLDENLREKLVKYYLKKYKKNKTSHDKIEFDIVYTCYNNSTERKIQELKNNGFKNLEIKKIKKSLKQINKNIFSLQKKYIDEIFLLEKRIKKIVNSKMYYIDKIFWLIEDCKNLGTNPFAGLARSAFVAVDILNSFVETRIITKEDKDNFLSGIKTISTEILEDKKKLSKKSFLNKHGHLRPNTYEITSLNYKDGYNFYFNKNNYQNFNTKKFEFSNMQLKKMMHFIKTSELDLSVKRFIDLIKNSIKFRELSKYYFSKSIDQIFEIFKFISKRHNISLEELSYLKIQTFQELYYELNNEDVGELLLKNIEKNKSNHNFNSTVPLPDSIYNANDIFAFSKDESKINFITQKIISGEIIKYSQMNLKNIKNKIVCIESADPGFDFIFSHKIKGLVTMYGGANSHMSIRCMELGIPAAIGVGKTKFDKIVNADFIYLDALTKKISLS